MNTSKQFESFFSDAVRVKIDEVIKPTRVVWRKSGTVTTKVFPTELRAWEFAATVKHLVCVQDVKDPVPPQSEVRQISNETFAKYGRIKGWWKKK